MASSNNNKHITQQILSSNGNQNTTNTKPINTSLSYSKSNESIHSIRTPSQSNIPKPKIQLKNTIKTYKW